MITLYLLEESRADRIAWALDILKLKYRLEIFPRNPVTRKGDPALYKIHPYGKSPILKDGDRTLVESGVIMDYLISTYGKDSILAPKNNEEKWAIEYGLFACESNFMISFFHLYKHKMVLKTYSWGLYLVASILINEIEKGWARPELHTNLTVLQDTIESNNGYFCGGHLSGADLMYAWNVGAVRTFGVISNFDTQYPGLVKWLNSVMEQVNAAKQHEPAIEIVRHESTAA